MNPNIESTNLSNLAWTSPTIPNAKTPPSSNSHPNQPSTVASVGAAASQALPTVGDLSATRRESVAGPSPTRRDGASDTSSSSDSSQSQSTGSQSNIPNTQPSPNPASPSSQPPSSDSPREAIFQYMMQTNPAFRRRHEALEKIRVHLKKAAETGSTDPLPPLPFAEDETAEIKSALRGRSPIDALPPERQRLLYQTNIDFGCAAVSEIITLPESEGGWGISTTERSLQRFQKRYAERLHSQRQAESRDLIRQILSDPKATDQEITTATERLFKLRLLESVNDPASSARDLRDLLHAHTRLRAVEIAAQRLHSKSKSKSNNRLDSQSPAV